jgi:tRNA(His) 5'-end guanylyltransferase
MQEKIIQSIDIDALSSVAKIYEKAYTDQVILPGSILMARLDGRAFHSLKSQLRGDPFSRDFTNCMIDTTRHLVREFHSDFGYTQSDEISLAWELKGKQSEFLFNGKSHKLNSLLAASCSVAFNAIANNFFAFKSFPIFDCRVWALPTKQLATDNILWRQLDAKKNSVSMLAHYHFSDKQLRFKSTTDRLQMLEDIGIRWDELNAKFKTGTFIFKENREVLLKPEELAKLPATAQSGPFIRSFFIENTTRLSKVEDKVGFLFRGNNEI